MKLQDMIGVTKVTIRVGPKSRAAATVFWYATGVNPYEAKSEVDGHIAWFMRAGMHFKEMPMAVTGSAIIKRELTE